MVKVKILEVYQPNIFLGADLSLSSKVSIELGQINRSSLLPSIEISPQQLHLFNRNGHLFRIRVLTILNEYSYKCLLIDDGRIEEVKKDKMYIIPHNLLKIDSSIKLLKVPGIMPCGLSIYHEGVDIKSKLSQSNEWIRASYKFVCRAFQDSSSVNVIYLKEFSKDKALVEVSLNYNNQRENLKDLLIREKYAFAVEEDYSPTVSVDAPLVTDDKPCTNSANTTNTCNGIKMSSNTSLCIKRTNKMTSWFVSQLTKDLQVTCKETYEYEYKNLVRPILSYQDDPMIATFLKEAMQSYKTKALFSIQTLMIPAILRGINVMAIAPHNKGKSMGILMPILQKIATKPVIKLRSYTPLAIILCCSWNKVQQLTEASKIFINFIKEGNDIRKPTIVSAFSDAMEKKIMIPILEGCDVLIITPSALLRLLKIHQFFKLKELEIMAMEDADDLFAQYFDDIKEIFHFAQYVSKPNDTPIHQIMTATVWTSTLESIFKQHMGNMFLLAVNAPLEAAIIAGIKHKFIECDNNITDIYEKLIIYLKMKDSMIHRTVIFSNDDKQIRLIFSYLSQKMSFDMKLMLGSMSKSELVEIQSDWNQHRNTANMPILLVSDEALNKTDISIFNSQTIFHADINPATFGSRVNFLKNKFSEISFLNKHCRTQDFNVYYSYIFINDANLNLCNANFLRELFIRCKDDVPKSLQI